MFLKKEEGKVSKKKEDDRVITFAGAHMAGNQDLQYVVTAEKCELIFRLICRQVSCFCSILGDNSNY